MDESFEIHRQEDEGPAPVFLLRGRLEIDAARELRAQALRERDAGRIRLILELSDVGFIASSGLGTLLLLTEEFREMGGDVILASLSTNVLQVVTLMNLGQFLTIEDSLVEARDAVAS